MDGTIKRKESEEANAKKANKKQKQNDEPTLVMTHYNLEFILRNSENKDMVAVLRRDIRLLQIVK